MIDGSPVFRPERKRAFRPLSRFKELAGCPVLVNTNFNVRGEPIVCTPEDAFRCFMGCKLDRLVIGDCYLLKQDHDPAQKRDYKDAFELDQSAMSAAGLTCSA